MLKATTFGTALIMVNMFMIAGAFVPDNANPFLNKNCCITNRRVTFFGSSDSNNNGEDSYGFFDDEEFDRQSDAYQFIFDIDEDSKPEDVFIILFNPDTEREGVHTLEYPKDSGLNKILAFESKEECEQFAASLKDQQFFDPKPQEMNLESLEDYCDQIRVDVQVVPEGLKLKPPKDSVLNLGLNPNLGEEMKMLDYLFQISNDEMGEESKVIDSGNEETNGCDGAWE